MANRMFAIRLVQWIGWVFETHERKKERFSHFMSVGGQWSGTAWVSCVLSELSFEQLSVRPWLLWGGSLSFGFFVLFKKTSVALICSVVGGEGFRSSWGNQYPRNLSIQWLRALIYEAERTLARDLPRHGAIRACPWLSTALVDVSVWRGRGGDR